MATPAHNVAPPPIDKILPPPREFGKDGGKFYRCYDNMAEEVDEDLTKGLKEQLDGLLTFVSPIGFVNHAEDSETASRPVSSRALILLSFPSHFPYSRPIPLMTLMRY